jgi:hypothetical protein
MHNGQWRLQIFVGSIVRVGGIPQATGLPDITDREKDIEVLIIFNSLRKVNERNNRPSNNSFKSVSLLGMNNLF